MRRLYLLLFIILLLLTLRAAAAVPNDADVAISFDDDDLSGSDPTDISGNNVPVRNRGTALTGQSGILEEAFYFDTNDYLNINYTMAGTGSDHTVAGWVYVNSSATANVFTDWTAGGNFNNRCKFYSGTNNTLTLICSGNAGSSFTVYGPTIREDGWVFVGYRVSDGNTRIYGNDSYLDWNNSMASYDYTNGVNMTFGHNTHNGANRLDGSADMLMVWERELSHAEFVELYNSGAGLNPYDTVPDAAVNNTLPYNGDNTWGNLDGTVNYTFEVQSTGNSVNCTLWRNETGQDLYAAATLTNLPNGTWGFNDTVTNETTVTWYVNCSIAGGDPVTSSSTWFIHDTTSPTITVNPNNFYNEANGTIIRVMHDSLTPSYNFTVADANLYKWNYTIINSTGDIQATNESENLSVTSATVTDTINMSSWPTGTYTSILTTADDHTNGPLHGLEATVQTDGITFSTAHWSKKIWGGYWANGTYQFLNAQQIENFDISFTLGDTGNGEYKWNMSYKKPAVDVKFGFAIPKGDRLTLIDEETGHFVWGQWYLDFEDLPENGYPIRHKETAQHHIIHTNSSYCTAAVGELCLLDPAVGGLNIVQQNNTFELSNVPRQSENLSASNLTSTSMTLSWDDPAQANGSTLYNGSGAALYNHTEGTTSFTVVNLTPGTTYTYWVFAWWNDSGRAIYNTTSSAENNVSASTLSNTSIGVTFTENAPGNIYVAWAEETVGNASGYVDSTIGAGGTLNISSSQVCSGGRCLVSLTFNNQTNGGWQRYEFFNNPTSALSDSIRVYDDGAMDSEVTFRVLTYGNNPIEHADIRIAQQFTWNTWGNRVAPELVGRRFTDAGGYTTFYLDTGWTQKTYTVWVNAPGYTTEYYMIESDEFANNSLASPYDLVLVPNWTSTVFRTSYALPVFFTELAETLPLTLYSKDHTRLYWNTSHRGALEAVVMADQWGGDTLTLNTHYNRSDFTWYLFDDTNASLATVNVTYKGNVTRGIFDTFRDQAGNGALLFALLILVLISIAIGAVVNPAEGTAGFHTFLVGGIALTLLFAAFWPIALVSTLYYVGTRAFMAQEGDG